MQLIKYNERSFVIFGDDTATHKELIKTLCGKWNLNLTHPITGEKFGGWIFSNRKLNDVSEALRNYIKDETPMKIMEYMSSQPETFDTPFVSPVPVQELPVVKPSYVKSNIVFLCFVFIVCYVIG